jgi:hypothetical protein
MSGLFPPIFLFADKCISVFEQHMDHHFNRLMTACKESDLEEMKLALAADTGLDINCSNELGKLIN